MNNVLYNRHLWLYLFIPFSAIYRFIIALRRFAYRKKFFKSKRFPVPVIVVGNITVGGTGKTPLIIWLAAFLQTHGYKPGIVSRGYGGKADQYPVAVTETSAPKIVGDEPVLIAKRSGCLVIVDPKRTNAVKFLLDNSACDIVLSDDGLQHYALARDIEIAVIDGQRRFDNGFCLPTGPLREPVKRLQEVDFIVTNGAAQKNEYAMQLQPDSFVNLKNPDKTFSVEMLKRDNLTIHAVAAIGNPQRFFETLRQILTQTFVGNLSIKEHPFPDHHAFTEREFNFHADSIVIMTEKDAVKCSAFAKENHWYLPVTASLSEGFGKELLRRLSSVNLG